MKTHGQFAPETHEVARIQFRDCKPAASTTVNELLGVLNPSDEVDRTALQIRAHNAIFASLLEVTTGHREAFETWQAEYDGEVRIRGHDAVGNVAWHTAPFAETTIATTYENEPEAAIATCRRIAFGECYREVVES